MDTKFSIHLILVLLSLGWSAASRPRRRDYRQFPSAALTYTEYPSYNIQDPNGPGTYAFGYEFEDPASGNSQFRDEERLANGTVRGSYGFIRPDGKLTVTRFWADERGYNSITQTYDQVPNPPPYQPPNEPADTSEPSPDYNPYEQPSLSPEEVEQILHDQKIDLHPTYNPINDPDVLDPNVATLLGGKQPFMLQSRDGKGRLSVQFVNNFIPSNFPVLTFQNQIPHQPIFPPPPPQPEEDTNDPVDHTDFVNDKFHDPIFDERQYFVRKKQNAYRYPVRRYPSSRYPAMKRPLNKKTQKETSYPEASTREALWFRDLIRSRRKEYLEKYSANYDSYTIPANYLVSP